MVPRALALSLLACLLVTTAQPRAQTDPRLTRAEVSGFEEVDGYADIDRVSDALAASPLVRRERIGQSEDGRDLPLLVIADPPIASAAEARKRGRPIVLVQAGLHAGETEGTAAALMLARRLIDGDLKPLTRQLVILIAPAGNPDGLERWLEEDLPSEPAAAPGDTGNRGNARGLDLNRDYMKLETTETRALAELLAIWDPHVVVDLHTAAGSLGGAALLVVPTLTPNVDARLASFVRDTLVPGVRTALADTRGQAADLAGAATAAASDSSPSADIDHRPRQSQNYAGLRNRIAVRVEVDGSREVQDRIAATEAVVEELWRASARHAQRILTLTAEADRALSARTRLSKPLELGLEFARQIGASTSAASPDPPFAATRSRALPTAWIIPRGLAANPRMAAALDRLRWHGIETETLAAPAQMDVDRFVVQALTPGEPAEGQDEARLLVTMERAALTVDPGSVLIKANQSLARLAFYLLEPDTDDGLVTWRIIADGLAVGQGFPVYRVR